MKSNYLHPSFIKSEHYRNDTNIICNNVLCNGSAQQSDRAVGGRLFVRIPTPGRYNSKAIHKKINWEWIYYSEVLSAGHSYEHSGISFYSLPLILFPWFYKHFLCPRSVNKWVLLSFSYCFGSVDVYFCSVWISGD